MRHWKGLLLIPKYTLMKLFQVFGHTQLREHIVTDNWACLDVRKAFILLENGSFEVV